MSLEMPDFNSELEEADWWFDHRNEVEAEFLVAAAEGRLTQGTTGRDGALTAVEVDSADLQLATETLSTAHQPAISRFPEPKSLRRAS